MRTRPPKSRPWQSEFQILSTFSFLYLLNVRHLVDSFRKGRHQEMAMRRSCREELSGQNSGVVPNHGSVQAFSSTGSSCSDAIVALIKRFHERRASMQPQFLSPDAAGFDRLDTGINWIHDVSRNRNETAESKKWNEGRSMTNLQSQSRDKASYRHRRTRWCLARNPIHRWRARLRRARFFRLTDAFVRDQFKQLGDNAQACPTPAC